MQRSFVSKSRAAVSVPVLLAAMVLGLTSGKDLAAADAASQADKDFVAQVSQGGLYEVEAGKIAAVRAKMPAVKNFGAMDAHDHEGVNSSLKRIAAATGVPIKPGLNTELTARLAKLKAVADDQFDDYYVGDMKQIHNKDEGLFVQEAEQGSDAYKNFAHQTAVLVKAHLGWLNTM